MKKLNLLILAFCCVCLLSNISAAQNCKFDKNGYKEVPTAHERIGIDFGEVKRIQGKIKDVQDYPVV